MRSNLFAVAVCVTGLVATTRLAGAAERPAANPFAAFGGGVSATLGLGTQVGMLGVEGQLDARPWLFLTAGAGLGSGGPQAAGMLHLRALFHAEGRSAAAATLGYGISGGRYHEHLCIFDACNPELVGTLWWHNVQAGLELRSLGASGRSSVMLHAFGGAAIAGNPHDLKCVCSPLYWYETRSHWLPFVGFSAGVGFH